MKEKQKLGEEMSMRINSDQTIKWLLVNDKEKKVTENTTSKNVKETEEDEIQFNVSAKELTEFFALAKQADEVREDKLDEVREKIESGTYNITGKDVIAKLMEGGK